MVLHSKSGKRGTDARGQDEEQEIKNKIFRGKTCTFFFLILLGKPSSEKIPICHRKSDTTHIQVSCLWWRWLNCHLLGHARWNTKALWVGGRGEQPLTFSMEYHIQSQVRFHLLVTEPFRAHPPLPHQDWPLVSKERASLDCISSFSSQLVLGINRYRACVTSCAFPKILWC